MSIGKNRRRTVVHRFEPSAPCVRLGGCFFGSGVGEGANGCVHQECTQTGCVKASCAFFGTAPSCRGAAGDIETSNSPAAHAQAPSFPAGASSRHQADLLGPARNRLATAHRRAGPCRHGAAIARVLRNRISTRATDVVHSQPEETAIPSMAGRNRLQVFE